MPVMRDAEGKPVRPNQPGQRVKVTEWGGSRPKETVGKDGVVLRKTKDGKVDVRLDNGELIKAEVTKFGRLERELDSAQQLAESQPHGFRPDDQNLCVVCGLNRHAKAHQ